VTTSGRILEESRVTARSPESLPLQLCELRSSNMAILFGWDSEVWWFVVFCKPDIFTYLPQPLLTAMIRFYFRQTWCLSLLTLTQVRVSSLHFRFYKSPKRGKITKGQKKLSHPPLSQSRVCSCSKGDVKFLPHLCLVASFSFSCLSFRGRVLLSTGLLEGRRTLARTRARGLEGRADRDWSL